MKIITLVTLFVLCACSTEYDSKKTSTSEFHLTVISSLVGSKRIIKLIDINTSAILCEVLSPHTPITQPLELDLNLYVSSCGRLCAVRECNPDSDNSLGEDEIIVFWYDDFKWNTEVKKLPILAVGQYFALAEPLKVSYSHLFYRINGVHKKLEWGSLKTIK